jgi:hypothetical protein
MTNLYAGHTHAISVAAFAGLFAGVTLPDVMGVCSRLLMAGSTAIVVGMLYTLGTIIARRLMPEKRDKKP